MADCQSEWPSRVGPRHLLAHLKFQHQVQPMLPQGVDGIDNQCYDNVNAIGLMFGYTGLDKNNTIMVSVMGKERTILIIRKMQT